MKAFEVRNTCDLENWMIGLTMEFHEKCPDLICRQSYLIFAAKLLGLTYADYLRYCVQCGGAVKGRNAFPVAYFKDKKIAERICLLINKEWDKFYEVYSQSLD